MIIATYDRKPRVQQILYSAFREDPHTTWLIEQSRNPRKLEILVNYVVEETFRRGTVYLTDDHQGVALWDSEKREPLTWHYLKRNIDFLFRVGFRSVLRILRSESMVHRHFRKYHRFAHLYMIGVLPEARGKGLASELMDPVLEKMKQEGIPLVLETANPRNVEIYKKKGFRSYKTVDGPDGAFHLMVLE